ncbi:hypothetical protein A6V39_03480 [Candidatus Mycoplasma haematobovis]|uniref:Uncharacterized protein n=1 Tax=Candidatus Mycoplasma haematobovis TaxID=432608 RepID=A0A1A9QBV5_9MOLU|nr:hypothetical protein [Candidatus Mycoplasma haematobovis]OAL09947.1 hypothetical protein A6V39_03480 [Candidatus Mycoplasma haematobovis]
MPSYALKIASIGIGVSGVVGGAGTSIYLLSKKETIPAKTQQDQEPPVITTTKPKITDLLAKNKLSLIEEDKDSGEWTRVLGTFKQDHTSKNPDGIWKVDGWDSKQVEEKGLPDLKRLCKQNATGEVDDEKSDVYKEVVKYCTKAITESHSD